MVARATALSTLSFILWGAMALGMDGSRAVSQYVLQVWQRENGLPHNSINGILQDRDGYLWLATQGGLVRFDGVRFSLFDMTNVPEMTSSAVSALAEDREGNLWFGLVDGALGAFKDGRFRFYARRDGLPGSPITALQAGRDGSLWIGTYGGGLGRMRAGRFSTYAARDGLPNDVIYAVYEDRLGNVWVGTDGGGLARLKEGRFTTFTTKDGLASDSVYALHEDRQGSLWIGTWGAGLNRLREGRFTTYGSKQGLTNGFVWSIHEDRSGQLWVGTWGGGLIRLGAGQAATLTKKDGLTSNIVSAICEDRVGNLWVGTSSGLNRLNGGPFTSFSTAEGLSDDTVLTVYEDRQQAVWIGTRNGLNRLRDGKIATYTTAQGLSSNTVTSLHGDLRGRLWIGTAAGLDRLSRGSFTVYTTKQGLPSDTIWTVGGDGDDTIWVGTPAGLSRFRDGRFTTYGAKQGLLNEKVLCLHQARGGGLWVGTDGGGLFRWRDGTFTSYAARHGPTLNFIQSLYEDRQGTLWMGAWGGLGRLRDGGFTVYARQQGLPDDVVAQILEDGRGNLWMRGSETIFRIRKQELEEFAARRTGAVTPFVYRRADGMKRSEYDTGGSQPAAWQGRDGRLWFATIEGVAVVDPAVEEAQETPPVVRIEGMLVDERPLHLDRRGAAEVEPGPRTLEFRYTGLGVAVPDQLRFQYRLEGLDGEWIDAGPRRVAYYTRPAPGLYRFCVRAGKPQTKWSDSATLEVRLKPFLYQTWAFRSAAMLALAALVTGLYRARTYRMRARHRELLQMVAERTKHLAETTVQLERANCELERIARLDALTGIPNRRHFDEILDREWRRALREQRPLAFIIIDIDFFKAYNDTYGHPRGDECLKRVAEVLTRGIRRPGDEVARYGGEEFVALLPATNAAGAALLAERIREDVAALALPHAGSSVAPVVTISAGVASAEPPDGGAPERLVACADRALYRAKQGGRNQVRVANAAECRLDH